MATANTDLSGFNPDELPSARGLRFGIVAAEWNEEVTESLQQGACETLEELGALYSSIRKEKVPGSYELPSGAQLLLDGEELDAVICLGSLIRGETAHFDFIAQAVSQGIKDVSLRYHTPTIFGVLTDENMQQARDRAGGAHGNKGVEAAISAVRMASLKKRMHKRSERSA